MKKQPLLTLLALFIVLNLSAQQNFAFVKNDLTENQSIELEKNKIKSDAEKEKVILAELRLIANYLSTQIEYPDLSRLYNVEGRVLIQFKFDGTLFDFKILESLNPECDQLILAKMESYAISWNKNAEKKLKELIVNVPIDFKMK